MTAIEEQLRKQFRFPRGPLGHLAGYTMARRESNVRRSRWSVEQLELKAEHRVLEIGYGPGIALEHAATISRSLVGLDHSEVMQTQAARRNRHAVEAGTMELRIGSPQDQGLLFSLGQFDRIYSINVWQFWDDQETVLTSLARMLRPGGCLATTYQPRHTGADASDADAATRCLVDQYENIGLIDIKTETLGLSPTPAAFVKGSRATTIAR